MREASDVLSRLQWDTVHLDSSTMLIGHEDRHEGMKEMPFEEWKRLRGGSVSKRADVTEEDFIPEHRIWYFRKTSGLIVWCRVEGQQVDSVYGSVERGKPLVLEEVIQARKEMREREETSKSEEKKAKGKKHEGKGKGKGKGKTRPRMRGGSSEEDEGEVELVAGEDHSEEVIEEAAGGSSSRG